VVRRITAVVVLFGCVLAVARPAASVTDPAPGPVADPPGQPPGNAATTGFHWHDIRAHDGVVLKSNVIAPASPGRHPGIVFIASWGLNDFQYLVPAARLASKGYVVLSYTVRGFWASGGTIEVGGPDDVADVSTVIDWLLAHTAADPARVGVAGVSYGAGIGLLATAHDPRIRAAVAMSGWTDMAASMYGGQTRRPQAAFFLQALANTVGRPSPDMNRILADYWADRGTDFRLAFCHSRSVVYAVDAVNRNHPAVLLVHSYGDSIFPANQMVDFFDRLTGPKRLELAPGDHATVEIPGLLGLPDHAWDSVHDWFDRYLPGRSRPARPEAAVVLRPHGSTAVEQYRDWPAVAPDSRRLDLGPQHIRSGTDTTANAGTALLSNGLEQLTGVPPLVWLPSVDRRYAGVWQSDPFPAGLAVRGVPTLHLTVRPYRPAGTVIAYLYDIDAAGVGRLVTHAPVTWLTAHGSFTVDLPLQVTAYDLPAGHRLALVADTRDPLYLDENATGGPLQLAGWLDIPIRPTP
jgi:predicted acyl esterase